MNNFVAAEDIISVIKEYLKLDNGDENTEEIIISIGAEILCISPDKLLEMINEH